MKGPRLRKAGVSTKIQLSEIDLAVALQIKRDLQATYTKTELHLERARVHKGTQNNTISNFVDVVVANGAVVSTAIVDQDQIIFPPNMTIVKLLLVNMVMEKIHDSSVFQNR